jgi:hypothetical protein
MALSQEEREQHDLGLVLQYKIIHIISLIISTSVKLSLRDQIIHLLILFEVYNDPCMHSLIP